MNKIEALTLVLNDPNRSASDRDIAKRALDDLQSASVNQKRQDHDLELWFSSRSGRSSSDMIEARKEFDQGTKQLLDDFGDLLMGFPDALGSDVAHRALGLYKRTASAIIREKFLPVLQSFAVYAPDAAVRHEVQEFLIEQGYNRLQDFFPINDFISVLERGESDPNGIIAERLKAALTSRMLPDDARKRYGRGELER
jgi:hypothetical protein